MKWIKGLFSGVVFFQVFFFFIFIFENLNNLTEVYFEITILDTDYAFTINFYTVLAIIGAFFGVVLLASINIFGLGLNDTGTANVGKLVGLVGMVSILSFVNSYYFLKLGQVGLIAQIFILIVYIFYAIDDLMGGSEI